MAAVRWLWDFGDGMQSSQQNPKHKYRRSGTYTVSLTVWDDLGNSGTEEYTDYIAVAEPDMDSTKISLRFATERSEGVGWNERSGDDWVSPDGDFAIYDIIDDENIPRTVVLDEDGIFYEIDTFDRTSAIKPPYLDKEEDDGTGTEIAAEIWFDEFTGGPLNEWMKKKPLRSFLCVRPQESDNRGATGYDDSGFRDAQEFSLEAYIDGEKTTPQAIAGAIPENGLIEFAGSEAEGHRVQFVVKAAASEFRLVARKHDLLMRPKAVAVEKRTIAEWNYQDSLNNKAFHVSNGKNLLLDRVTKTDLGGSYTRATGPDGRTSGFVIANTVEMHNAAVAGNYTVMFWWKAGSTIGVLPGVFTQYGDTTAGGWILYYQKGAGGCPANLTMLAGTKAYVRIVKEQLSAAALESYYHDVVHNQSRAYEAL